MKVKQNYFKEAVLSNVLSQSQIANWDIFITWKINSGLVWAAGQYMKKKFGADNEQLLRAFFLCFEGQKKTFENVTSSALKSCIEKR